MRLRVCLGSLLLCAGLCALPAAADVRVYPTGALNPRVPTIPTQASPAGGHEAPFDASFTYALTPLLNFPDGGELTVLIRDNLRRAEKRILSLGDGASTLSLRISPAAQDRKLELVIADGDKTAASIAMQRPASGWSRINIRWQAGKLTLVQDQKPAGSAALPKGFSPRELAISTWHIADLSVRGDGGLKLDWGDGYAARVQCGRSADATAIRLFGFDTYVVSQDTTKRDCPMVQVINAGSADRLVNIQFQLNGEMSAQSRRWQQTLRIPPRSEVLELLAFPTPLTTDVYHLKTQSDAASPLADRHFIFVQRRPEPPGKSKFGLHDSGAKAFGYWPDALPIDLAHVYASWAYIQGPPWVKDFDGTWGIDPKLPPEQWNWPARLDWFAAEGRPIYLCVQSVPFLDWQRSKAYPESKMKKYGWGWRGGAPDDAKYRAFLKALVARYRTKVWAYEIENEPNTGYGFEPADYAEVAKAVYQEVKSADGQARVFGICGTDLFGGWMSRAFDAGSAPFMDGVSWHTYITPATAEEAGLGGVLGDITKRITATGRPMAMLNSETGTYVAPREDVDTPIEQQRLNGLIAEGVQPLAKPSGWPFRALSERAGAISLVSNATTNFLAGAERFVFFGWNPEWPKTPRWWGNAFDDSNFAMLSVSKDGQRTPSRFTLAAGVLTAQLEPADCSRGTAVRDYQLRGATFPTTRGRMAVLWCLLGRQTVLVESPQQQLEVVSLFGQVSHSEGREVAAGRFLHAIEVTEEPVYVHGASPEMSILPSLVQSAVTQAQPSGNMRVTLQLRNPLPEAWKTDIVAGADAKWEIQRPSSRCEMQAGSQTTVALSLETKRDVPRGRYPLEVKFTLPDGRPYLAAAEIAVMPNFGIPRLPAGMSLSAMRDWNMPGGPLQISRPEQTVTGRPPAMASLQEKQYWSGPQELSGEVKIAADDRGLCVYVDVRDTNAALPATWPGVNGSCVELFLDFRPPGGGLGAPGYGPAVHQLILRPALDASQSVAVWKASGSSTELAHKVVEGGRIDATRYWVAIGIPWSDAGITPASGRAIAMDVGIDGAREGGGARKSQMMLFGTAMNNRNASGFGLGFLP